MNLSRNLFPVLFIALFIVLQASLAFATAQAPDKVIYQKQERMLFANPLENLYTDADRPNFMIKPFVVSSGNWRGYVATWEIDGEELYLKGIDSYLCSGQTEISCKKVKLKDLFPGKVQNDRILADWFTGKLRIPDGKQLQYVHMGYGSSYERDIILDIQKGKVGELTIVDNTKATLPDPMTAARTELELLKNSNVGQQPMFGGTGKSEKVPKQSREPKSGIVIVPGTGVFKHGTKRSEVEAEIGDGEASSKYSDVYFVEYPKAGVQVSYYNANDTVRVIFLYNGQSRYENFAVPVVRTDKGIGWNSSVNDVLEAYGKPLKNYGGGNENWQRVEYPGIDFLFQNGKLGRIGILSPDGN